MLVKSSINKFVAIGWLLTISVLFFLPGSALPKEPPFEIPHFDKLIHFGFIALLSFLWRLLFPPQVKYSWLLLLLTFIYGLIVEVIQHYFIANRGFDLQDLFADTAGAIAGLLFWSWGYKKK